ncbi:MAG: hypothetical protein DMD81_10445 [Candidatus Rokuibacteriota bacterium]|nr:MAG: hypothetical protein DMD81_10445 [Candidatus Rokubacteria bacterium]
MSRRADVRAIFFDAGNTLVRMNFAAVADRLRALGVTVTTDALIRAERRARVRLDEGHLARSTSGTETRSTQDAYLRYVLDEVGIVDDALVTALAGWRRDYNVPVGLWELAEPNAEPALALARAAGLRTAVISNSNGSIRSSLTSLGLARHLELVIDSFEVGVEKPDPRIFRLGLDRMQLGPAQAVYVGDMYSIDVRGARAVGIDAILLDPEGCWGERDCLVAVDVLSAVRLVVERYSAGTVTNG